MHKSAEWGTPLVSLDVSTAFLQGDSFEELNASGHARQQCAFCPPAGVFQLLHEIDPEGGWGPAAADPSSWCFELDKGAYGLKDAPLLWFMRINRFMIAHHFLPTKHDACVYYHLDESNEIDALVSLHVDDTLATGSEHVLENLHDVLEDQFGSITAEVDDFKHFGVHVHRDVETFHVHASQADYVKDLELVIVPKGKADTKADATLQTSFRSAVSAVAWVGVTHAGAAAAASLYQGCLPIPSYEDMRHLNAFINELKQTYVPLVFRHDLDFANLRILVVSDSSLGNVSKYSQGGYFVLLCAGGCPTRLCGHCSILSFRSSKSKRVASSTLHAECLALVAATEEASHLQTWLYELKFPMLKTLEILNAEPRDMISIIGITDCKDLLDVLCKTAVTAVTNKAMTLYVAALRELKETGRVESWGWVDTRDNVSNGLTKLSEDGTLPMSDITNLHRCAACTRIAGDRCYVIPRFD
jgi:hypothetical protein